jgi:hypothetical protein
MSTTTSFPSAVIAIAEPAFTNGERLALTGYSGPTREPSRRPADLEQCHTVGAQTPDPATEARRGRLASAARRLFDLTSGCRQRA